NLAESPSTRLAGERAGVGGGAVDVAELHAPFTHQEWILRDALGLEPGVDVNPSGGPLCANPVMAAGLIRIRQAGGPHRGRRGAPRGGARDVGAVSPAEPGLRAGGSVMTSLCAVVGIGQTHHTARRDDVSIAGLVREAALHALEDAALDWRDIDAVVVGKAPDMFEGVMMP